MNTFAVYLVVKRRESLSQRPWLLEASFVPFRIQHLALTNKA